MTRFFHVSVLAFSILVLPGLTRADESDVKAIIDKGIKSLGGEEKLRKAATASWKSKATLTLNGSDNEFKSDYTIQGLDHYRMDLDGEINGNAFKGAVVLNGDKGWRSFGETMAMDADSVANEKRTIYLSAIPSRLVVLKDKEFKAEAAGDESVGDKKATVLKITCPDGKDFKLLLDKESGLPLKLVANVIGFDGAEFTMENTYADYKDFDGIKKATKITSKRDGEKFMSQEISDFKILEKAPAEAFAEPK